MVNESKRIRRVTLLLVLTALVGSVGSSAAFGQTAQQLAQLQQNPELVQQYREQFANPYVAAARGYIDDVIEPRETRPRLINGLEMLANKRDSNPPKKHGNIPL